MNLYVVIHGDGVFEYHHFLNTDSLKDINLRLGTKYTLLHSSDMDLLRGCGGTVLYKENGSWVIHYLVDLDFKGIVDYTEEDEDWKSKMSTLIKSVKRDMALSQIIN